MEKKIFAEKNALVIGGTKGTGLEIARLLLQKGAKVTCTGRNTREQLSGIEFIFCDIDNCGIENFCDGVIGEKLSATNILVVTFGPFCQKPLHLTAAKEWTQMALDNYALPGILASKAIPAMMERRWGRIIFFGGTRTESVRGYKTNAAYAGAKTGISVITKSIAMEYAQYGITCNAVLPGFTSHAPEGTQTVSEHALAENAVSLMSKEELNGVLLNVDRGWSV